MPGVNGDLAISTEGGLAADSDAPHQALHPQGPGAEPGTLPAGVAPGDISGGSLYHERGGIPAGGNVNQWRRTGTPAWSVPNDMALSVWERATTDFGAVTWTIESPNTFQVAMRQKGRKSVTLIVPASASYGVVIAPTEGEVQLGNGILVPPGGALTIATEAPIWCAVDPAASAGDDAVVGVLSEYNLVDNP